MMRAVARWMLPSSALLAALAIAWWAYGLAAQAWDGVVSYRSPYADAPLGPGVDTTPVAERVVLVVIDGLRLDASRRMTTLQALRDFGGDYVLTTGQPSLSYPNWTTIVSGTTQDYHGVVTNWHEGAAPVETLFDTAEQAGVPYVSVGPSDIATLYPAAARADGTFFREWADEYLSATYVDAALDLAERKRPRFLFLHLPDVDEAGHDFGGTSTRYEQTVARVDADLRRLVEGLQDGKTAFVIVSDHGHIDSGGHGGWEPDVVRVPCVMAGAGVRIASGDAALEDVAPTVAVLSGLPVPRLATGEALARTLTDAARPGLTAAYRQRLNAVDEIDKIVLESTDVIAPAFPPGTHGAALTDALDASRRTRLESDRDDRADGMALVIALGALAGLVLVAVMSWRAAAAAFAGTGAYYVVYNVLFFLVHGNKWSLSAFNSEDLIDAWMNQRLIEAAVAGLVAALVAGAVYPALRRAPKGPRGPYLAGWLALGPVTVLVVQLTLALQIAWFIWAWGIVPEWSLPDLRWGFKFDLDLIQTTALGAAALSAPVVTYLVGRYHPKVRKNITAEGA